MNNANNINSHFGDDYTKFHEQVKSEKIAISPKLKSVLLRVADRIKDKAFRDKAVERIKKVA